MSTSRDVKALFDRFGGDATSYREIRMENEARDARERWPLLGMTDPREVALPASSVPRASALTDPAACAGGEAGAGAVHAQRDRSQAALRRSAPLFTRSPRRDVPPVVETKKPDSPESSAFRFSSPPVEAVAGQDTGDMQFNAGHEAATPAPMLQPAKSASASPAISGSPVSPNAAPLKKLFGAAAATSQAGGAQPVSVGGELVRLDTLFDRLRVGGSGSTRGSAAGEAKADVPARPWFLRGASER